MILDAAFEEIDIKTGLVRWEWHSLDHVDVNESETSPPLSRAWDWFHLNSIDPEPNGDIFVSARNTWAGYQIDGATGRILWRSAASRAPSRWAPARRWRGSTMGAILPDGRSRSSTTVDPPEPNRGHGSEAATTRGGGCASLSTSPPIGPPSCSRSITGRAAARR